MEWQIIAGEVHKFGISNIIPLNLRSSLNYLSRKAEGIGPVKPWQPIVYTLFYEGANSSTSNGTEISQSKSLEIFLLD